MDREAQDSFLAVFVIISILFTLVINVTLLAAIRYTRDEFKFYLSLGQMCALNLCAGLLILPVTIIIASDRKIADGQYGQVFCQVIGSLSSFIHRATTYNLCLAYFERFMTILLPMTYRNLTIVPTFNSIFALIQAITPFTSQPYPYKLLDNAPMCVHIPTSDIGQFFLYFNAAISYALTWFVMCVVCIGMLWIACSSGTSQSRIVPVGLSQKRNCPTSAWGEANVSINSPQQDSINGAILKSFLSGKSRKRKMSVAADTNKRKRSVMSTNLTFCDQLTLHRDGTAHMTSSSVEGSSGGRPFSISRELTVREGRSAVFKARVAVQGNKTRNRLNVASLRQNVPSINTKALLTLSSTLFVFSLIDLPVLLLHTFIFDQAENDGGTIEIFACVTMVATYTVYPLLNVIADKEMKSKVALVFHKMLETEFDSEIDGNLVERG